MTLLIPQDREETVLLLLSAVAATTATALVATLAADSIISYTVHSLEFATMLASMC